MRNLFLSLAPLAFLGAIILLSSSAQAQTAPCVAGKVTSMSSGEMHECNGVSLLSHVTPANMGQAWGLNDIWGWSDSETDLEVVLSGWRDGVSVIDVTDPANPTYIALIPKTAGTNGSTWRDVKVYGHYAYIVSEADSGPTPYGVQVIDLSVLRGHTGDRQVLLPVATYFNLHFAHNIVINEESGFAYAVGARGGESCGGGLHAIDIRSPENPVFAGCISDLRTSRGYTHDAQCVMYKGPDAEHTGKEICVGSNENAISIVDVTDKENPVYLGIGSYADAQYVHQSWLSEDQKYLFQNDELDELRLVTIEHTRTLVWDVQDLDDPILVDEFFSANTSIDHNMYVKGNYMYQSNYIDGLHVLDVSNPSQLSEKAFFDSHPATITSVWDGTWSNYPYLRSGAIAINSDPGGVYMVCLDGVSCAGKHVSAEDEVSLPAQVALNPAYPNPFNPQTTIQFSLPVSMRVRVSVSDALGREVAILLDANTLEAGTHSLVFDATGMPSGTYLVRLATETSVLTRQMVLLK